ncbi:hypothetical protein LINPERHAP1_LOCUS36703 [Linum perenne]
MVGMIVNAYCLLHNFIWKEGGPDVFELAYLAARNSSSEASTVTDDTDVTVIEPSDAWTRFRNNLANDMWANRRNTNPQNLCV